LKINIKTFFFLICGFLLLLIGVLVDSIFELNHYSKELKNIENNRHLMMKKASELRQTSDDLTRCARTYTVTGTMKYKDNYFTILNIHKGTAPRPKNYDGIYWDLSEQARIHRHPLGKKVSLINGMKTLPYIKYEFERLRKAAARSKDLVIFELEAFNAMKGLYKDDSGEYTITSEVNQQFSIKLLHSEEFHRAKEEIMLPVDDVLFSLKKRTEKEIDVANLKIEQTFQKIFILLILAVIALIMTMFMIRKKVLLPISNLTKTILSFQKGEKNIIKTIYNDDEIGLMTEQFFTMKQKLDDDYDAIEKLSLSDPLTKISNRRGFFEISDESFKLTQRSKSPLTLMILDIDFFKEVNDTYGHIVGDDILKYLVKNIKKVLRDSDVFARFGGEEFIVLLPQTDITGALEVAEKIRLSVEINTYVDEEVRVPITISIGVSEYNDERELKQLIQKADNALYIAKDTGRNKIEVK
jgi:diguanylate cyclase (GGDEF)-like protein